MFKKLMILSAILSVSACSSFSRCEADKNYVVSNPENMNKYENKINNHIKTSVYFDMLENDYCNDDACSSFDSKKFNFIEKKFNDKIRNGIYTIKESSDLNDPNCFPIHPLNVNKVDKKCFIATKNENNKINSEYTFSMKNINRSTKITFNETFNGLELYKVSYQIYSTGAIGGPGFAFCKTPYMNHPNYKFHMTDFVNGGFYDNSEFYKKMEK
jgi:hypothetical protein